MISYQGETYKTMNIHFYSPINWFEDWDWRNADEKGIGGSETSHIEMAWRLARRGHKVTSYAPIPSDCPRENRGVVWRHVDYADFTQPGLWIIYRSPKSVDKLNRKDQLVWVVCQDVDYPGEWSEERISKIDKVLGLCNKHASYLVGKYPELGDKVFVSSNGVRMDLIREVCKNPPERNPKRIMYASSPDRGLSVLLDIFNRAREQDHELELHAFYGMGRWDSIIEGKNKQYSEWYKKIKEEVEYKLKQPGVFWRDKKTQPELYMEWLKSGIWCYPTNFSETSCITAMEAQALGCIPITNPYWALEDNVLEGVFIPGNPSKDNLVKARYVDALVKCANGSGKFLDELREKIKFNASNIFNWERVVDQWENWIMQDENSNEFPEDYVVTGTAQFNFQHKHARGKIANVGCNDDGFNFRDRGAVNIDVNTEDELTKRNIPVDVIADARFTYAENEFDTVILGDILEHMTDDDVLNTLESAKIALKDGGRIIVTVPDDFRNTQEQHIVEGLSNPDLEYTHGVSHYHTRRIPEELVRTWFEKAGLEIETFQEIDYTFCLGWGAVVK